MKNSQSAPALRCQTAPAANKNDWANTSLPSIRGSSPAASPQGGRPRSQGGSARSQGVVGLFKRNHVDSLMHSVSMMSTFRSNSPKRPGTRLGIPVSRALTPYLLSGFSDSVADKNDHGEAVALRMQKQDDAGSDAGAEDTDHGHHGHGMPDKINEADWANDTEAIDKSLKSLHHAMEHFDPLHKGKGAHDKKKKVKENDDDEGGDEDNKDKFEAYKWVRKIEPELPPLTRMPPLSNSARLPDTPCIEYNLSLQALEKCLPDQRMEAMCKRNAYRDQQGAAAVWRRDNMVEQSAMGWTKALLQKTKQAEQCLDARRTGGAKAGSQGFDIDVVAEKWVVVYAMAAFLKTARTEVDFSHKPSEEKMEIIRTRQASGIIKSTDVMHVQKIQLDEYLQDFSLVARLDMMAKMFQAKMMVKARRFQARKLHACLGRWQPKSHIFICMRKFIGTIRYVQGWWRRTSVHLREVRDKIAKRWEKIERHGTSGQPHDKHNEHAEIYDPAKRKKFLENELRARRFLILSTIKMWEEDSRKWTAAAELRRVSHVKQESSEFALAPMRPTHLPMGHVSVESPERPCCETCLGRQGDKEILAMIKAARANPKGGGWTEIPKKKSGKAKGKKREAVAAKDGEPAAEEEEKAAESFFGDPSKEDLKHWNVSAGCMPMVGRKPGADEGEGRYP